MARLSLRAALLLGWMTVVAGEVAAAEPRHLLLVSVDTLRADHLSCYGFRERTTPHLDGLAESGVLFEDTLTTIGKTGPAFASLFTSLYPPTHGARRNGVKLRPDVPVLAELLRARGYATAAFISNWTLRDRLSGLARGFDHYDETFNRSRYGTHGAERGAPTLTRDVLAWLQARAAGTNTKQPLFLWVHYSEPHTPYDEHPGFTVAEPTDGRSDGWQKRQRYASEVRFVDHWIGELLAGAGAHLAAGSTFTVFVGDHGESLGEHRYWGHGKNTYWPNLRIPLILAGPGLPRGVRTAAPVSIIDLLPTVLELLELEGPPGGEGVSLVGTWQQPLADDRPRFALGDRHTAIGKKGRRNYEDPLMISMQTKRTKTVYDFAERRIAYYDLARDPFELEPLAKQPIATVPPLGRRLANWYRALGKYESKSEGELDPEDVRQLRSLGYIGD